MLDEAIPHDVWQQTAGRLKRIAKARRFLADDTRTPDISSVLRVPGTLNYKYSPPRPVSLMYAATEFIERSVMLEAIAAAHDRLCNAVATKPINPSSLATSAPAGITCANTVGTAERSNYGPPDLARLASALAVLDPDCDEETWKLKRLAPLALAAHANPESSIELYELARSWSSGELGGQVARKWITPGGNGRTGEDVFDEVWDRFVNTNYAGTPVTVGSIYYDARQVGWGPEESFELIDDEGDA